MPKAWRRTGRDAGRSTPTLLSSVFTSATRVLVLTFDRNVTALGVFVAASVRVFSGVNRWDWAVTNIATGYALQFTQALPAGDGSPQFFSFAGGAAIIRDDQGKLFAAGFYPVTIV